MLFHKKWYFKDIIQQSPIPARTSCPPKTHLPPWNPCFTPRDLHPRSGCCFLTFLRGAKFHAFHGFWPQLVATFEGHGFGGGNTLLKIDLWKRGFLLETTIFRGYVSFREGKYWSYVSRFVDVVKLCICWAGLVAKWFVQSFWGEGFDHLVSLNPNEGETWRNYAYVKLLDGRFKY